MPKFIIKLTSRLSGLGPAMSRHKSLVAKSFRLGSIGLQLIVLEKPVGQTIKMFTGLVYKIGHF